MREYGTLYTEFWIDPVTRALSDDAKLLAIYCLSSPHTTSLGCFRVPLAYLADDLNWPLERVRKALKSCSGIGFLIYDESTSWLFIPKFLKWNIIGNPNQWLGIKNLLQKVPKSLSFYPQLIQAILTHVRHLSEDERKGFETLAKPFLNQEQDQKQEPDQDQNNHSVEPTQTQENAIQQIFLFWQKTFEHRQAKLDKKRKSIIQKALKAGYTIAQLCEAITGCSLTPHNLGYNERGQRYDGLGVIFRDADNIDRFIHNCHNPPPMATHKQANQNLSTKVRIIHDEFAHKQYNQTPVEDIHWFQPNPDNTSL